MDLREIIKWFIPCFHILLKLDARMTLIWLLLFCNLCPGISASELDESSHLNNAKNVVSYENNFKFNQSEVYGDKLLVSVEAINDTSVVRIHRYEHPVACQLRHVEVQALPARARPRPHLYIVSGRTFGRPMKKMMQALIPLAMAIGSAGTWAVVAALIGAKTLVVTLFILKLLLMAGAAKFGGLLGAKLHHQPAPHYAPPPSKEIHLHIHNGQHGHHEHEEEVIPNILFVASWSRDSPVSSPASISSKVSAEAYNPYLYLAGPQTIRTPYGNYVKVD
ncbi:uncharacterized protein LOC134659065 [Cydia amplana]|uniref:uncharacterized protein LOC134659065 n=1 Tax=Cydia amplana TaxID=1869771 RepID=UPI002FE652CE